MDLEKQADIIGEIAYLVHQHEPFQQWFPPDRLESVVQAVSAVVQALFERGYTILPSNITADASALQQLQTIISSFVTNEKIGPEKIGPDDIDAYSLLHSLAASGWTVIPPR